MRQMLLLISIPLIVLAACAATELRVPDPTPLTPRAGFLSGEEVYLVIHDGRTEKEESAELMARIEGDLRAAFPAAKLVTLPDADYGKKPEPGRITVKIGISTYAAAFGPGVKASLGTFGGKFYYGRFPEDVWNGVTGLSVHIFDNRKGRDKTDSENIGKVISLPATAGSSPARLALFRSYADVIRSAAAFVEHVLMR